MAKKKNKQKNGKKDNQTELKKKKLNKSTSKTKLKDPKLKGKKSASNKDTQKPKKGIEKVKKSAPDSPTVPRGEPKEESATPGEPQFAYIPVSPVENPSQEPVGGDLRGFDVPAHTETSVDDNASDGLTEAFEEGFNTYAPDEFAYEEAPSLQVPDGWRIEVEDDMSVLMFTKEDAEVLTVPLTETFLDSFLEPLNQLHLSQSEAATSWQIRLPEDSDQPPVFSMMKNGAVAASLPLNEEIIGELLPALRSYDVRGVPVELRRRTRLRAWMRRHKFWSTVLIIILVPIAAYIIFAIGQQIFFTPLG